MNNKSELNPAFSSTIMVFVLLGTLVPLLVSPYPAMQDTPDWSFQAKVFNDLIDGNITGTYSLKKFPVPNSIVTWGIALLNHVFSLPMAAKIFCALAAIFFSVSYISFIRFWSDRSKPFIEIIGAFYGVGHFFWMGYINFLMGTAVLFVGLRYGVKKNGDMDTKNALALSFCFLAAFFCHFLAFAAMLICVAGLLFHFHRFKANAYLKAAIAAIPSFILLGWYVSVRQGEFLIKYSYGGVLNWIWFKVGPFTPATGFYPVTPEVIQWLVAALNILFCAFLFAIFVVAGWQSIAKRRSPFCPALIVLIGFGLFGPVQLYEVVRPFARLLFIGTLLMFAFSDLSIDLEKRLCRFAAPVLVCISILNGAGAFHAGLITNAYTHAMGAVASDDEAVLAIADSHFGMRSKRSFTEKLRDPFSYPNWVNPLKHAHQWRNAQADNYSADIFPSGVIEQEFKAPAVNNPAHLHDTHRTDFYELLAISGKRDNVFRIKDHARSFFNGIIIEADHFTLMGKGYQRSDR